MKPGYAPIPIVPRPPERLLEPLRDPGKPAPGLRLSLPRPRSVYAVAILIVLVYLIATNVPPTPWHARSALSAAVAYVLGRWVARTNPRRA